MNIQFHIYRVSYFYEMKSTIEFKIFPKFYDKIFYLLKTWFKQSYSLSHYN
jgi:hypothetical protein